MYFLYTLSSANKLVSAVIVSCINAKERIPKATVRFFLEFSLEAKDE